MIDYEKLKQADELARNTKDYFFTMIFGERKDTDGSIDYEIVLYSTKHEVPGERFECIEDLLIKLQELTKPKPKYKLDDLVWLYDYHDKKITSFKIDAISKLTLKYSGDNPNSEAVYEEIPEEDLYPSKKELIEAQIKYWTELMDGGLTNEATKICQHESNGKLYGAMEWGAPGRMKCIKCGDFYS